MKAHMYFILSVSHTALRGDTGDISVLARRYLRLCPQISPPMAYYAPINSANGLIALLFMNCAVPSAIDRAASRAFWRGTYL